MRKVIVGAFVSLDGIMQAPGGPHEDPIGGFEYGGWAFPYFDDTMGEFVSEMFAKPFDLLLGRKTYDIFAAHWPYVGPDDPIGPLFNRITKYVATRNPHLKLDWQNSETLGTDVVAAVNKLKGEEGPDLLTQGSTDFLQTLFRNDLVDEHYISFFPIMLEKARSCSATVPFGRR
jgi:dihydrofolate reductase